MKRNQRILITVMCLVLGLITTISQAQAAQADLSPGEMGAGANLVVTSVSGPIKAFLNQKISLTYKVQNQGGTTSGSYQVKLYLSKDAAIDPAGDRLLGSVNFAAGIAPGASKQTTSKVLVPINGLSGKYYFGAVVASTSVASPGQVSIVRYEADNNGTVTDHKTGLMWQQSDDGVTRSWNGARQYCSALVLDGKSNWRLPRIEEQLTIVDFARVDPAVNPVFELRSEPYWSSSTYADNSGYAWRLNHKYGYGDWGSKNNYYFVQCVRGTYW